MEPHKITWSHSSLKAFETCPRQFHEVNVLKKYPREETEQTRYGTRLHEQAELFIKDGRPLDADFKFMQPVMDKLLAMPGRKLPELEMALRYDLSPCGFHDEDRWCRGIADLVILDDENFTARVFDYKSGGDKYPDTDQLDLMSLMIYKTYPHIRHVTSGLLFVLKNTVVKHRTNQEKEATLWWDYRERIVKIAMAHATGVWNPQQSGLCKRYCAVTHCEHNGRN